MATFFMTWRLEIYWRALNPRDRWRFKYLAVGFFLISGSFLWCASYRLSYMRLLDVHFQLLAILLLIAWLFVSYAVARHRLLNRNVFVSRRVVYSAVAPTIFAGYLILLGSASLMMRAFGWPLHFVLQWLLIVLGFMLITVLALSSKVRKFVRYFISTHFYVNKYEYRDEWLTFSNLLRGTLTERGVAQALHRVLKDSLYTDTIMIWLSDTKFGFYLTDADKDHGKSADTVIAADDPLVLYLQNEPHLYLGMPLSAQTWQRIVDKKKDFFLRSGLVLVLPLITGGQCVGMVGLGPEHATGRYGRDDFDLLTALCSQAASAILAARSAEKLAQARETNALNTLSTFVLHDIKNAAAMLSLVKENAPAHIHNPEFQRDLLESIDDALRRMNKVQERLKTLKGMMTPSIKAVEIGRLVCDCCKKLTRKLPDLIIDVQCRQNSIVQTDSEMIAQILENLMLNALEAGGPGTKVHIEVSHTDSDHKTVQLDIGDNGPGIPAEMLPDRLFDPFKTTKPNGTGIGLWQVRMLVESLDGSIDAENVEGSGAKFWVRLPINGMAPEEA
jgi:putative PEP-CTERM system histidine kinase